MLQENGWCSSLSAGEGSDSYSGAGTFHLRIALTETGHAHVQSILTTIFHYIRLLHTHGVQVYPRLHATTLVKFRYEGKKTLIS